MRLHLAADAWRPVRGMPTLKRVRSLPARGAEHVVITERGARQRRATDRRISDRRRARIAGIFFVITLISIPALPLYNQVLNHHRFIVGSGGDLRVELGASASHAGLDGPST